MKTQMTVTKPDDIEIELSITMKLGKWRNLQKQLTDDYPSWDLSAKITDMIYQAQKNFYPKEDV